MGALLTFSRTQAKTGQFFCVTAGKRALHSECTKLSGISVTEFFTAQLIIPMSHELINTFRGDYCPQQG